MQDEKYMRQAVELARRGAGFVSPNPMVGCVIVKKGSVIAKGYHERFGSSHAEINALKEIRNKKLETGNLTVYVNLEPCCHWGKTPPCVEAIIAAGVKRVVIGMKDPNPKVAGKSIRKLRRAGIRVDLLENYPSYTVLVQCIREMNESFSKWVTTGRPFVLFKCVVTLDGALTLKKDTETPLGGPETMRRVHELRQAYDAVAVGVETVLIDDPRLTCRLKTKKKRNPLRAVFDTHLRIREDARLFRESGRTVIFTGPRVSKVKKQRLERKYTGLKIIAVRLGRDRRLSLSAAFAWLGRHGVASVMVEGGAKIAESLLRQKLVAKFIIIITPSWALDPLSPRLSREWRELARGRGIRKERVGDDLWFTGYPVNK